MLTYVLTGLATAVIGVRLYNVYFKWGDYRKMVAKFGARSIEKLTIIITGCNTGIGKEVARELYKQGARVIMANRNETQTQEIINEFRKQFPSSNGRLIFRKLDLSSMDSVQKFSKDVIADESRLDILINNAAVFGAPAQITQDGFEINTQVNHLAPALLTKLLLPKLQESQNDCGRIISVTSTLTKSGLITDDFLSKKSMEQAKEMVQNRRKIYSSSKLANLLFMRCLATQKDLVKNVEICFASPGFCFSRLFRYASRSELLYTSLFIPLFLMIMKTPKQGAQTIIGCSMMKHVRSDVLYHDCDEDEQFFRSGIFDDPKVYDQTIKCLKEFC